MKCFNCDNDEDSCVFGELYNCDHCDGKNLIEYNSCSKCRISWKSVNGRVIENSIFSEEDLLEVFNGGLEDIFNKISKQLFVDDSSMSGMIHRCLKCNAISYEVRNGKYRCSNSNCGFEWEVVGCG